MPAMRPAIGSFWTDRSTSFPATSRESARPSTKRKKELDEFEKRLTGERDELRKVRAELEGMRREVTDNIPKIEASEKANIKNLAKTYSAMKPADAVAVMRELDDSAIVKILASMKADASATSSRRWRRPKKRTAPWPVRAARLSEHSGLCKPNPRRFATMTVTKRSRFSPLPGAPAAAAGTDTTDSKAACEFALLLPGGGNGRAEQMLPPRKPLPPALPRRLRPTKSPRERWRRRREPSLAEQTNLAALLYGVAVDDRPRFPGRDD